MKNTNQHNLFQVNDKPLTVLSYGAGQDSTALLEKYINDPVFRQTYVPGDFLVVMADTGDEYDATYEHVERTKKRCKEHGIEFVFITADMGYHSETWKSLTHFYRTKGAIGSKAYVKSCSDNLKIQPIYKFLEDHLGERYGVKVGRKKGFLQYAAEHGKLRVMIGIAAGEEKRVADPQKNPNRWYRESITNVYPLIDLGMDRQACQEYIAQQGQIVPPPSNCKRCPWLSLEELEYMRRFMPEDLAEWVELEAAKIAKHSDKSRIPVINEDTGEIQGYKNRNYGVWGVKLLPEKIEEAKAKLASWTDQAVRDYRFSHGHCVATRY